MVGSGVRRHREWVRLDNASNIFLAARTDADPKVFRISAELDHDVDPVVLQAALDATYDRYRLYHAVLRRGVFWYYLQDSDLRPQVTADEQYTCAPIYRADRRNLLFRVMHHRQRIVLELFHALSDGIGALWFLSDLVTAYVQLRVREPSAADESSAGGSPDPLEVIDRSGEDDAEWQRALVPDSFAHYFRQNRSRGGVEAGPMSSGEPVKGRPAGSRVHRVHGTRTPDNRPRLVEFTMPVAEVLTLARAEGVSLTMYLTGLLFESIRLSSGGLGRSRTLTASVPVNLRQFFPSQSPRNFFATTRVEHTYGEGADDLGTVCRQLDDQFRRKVTRESLDRKLRRFSRFERMPVLRIVPRPLKDVILGLINRGSNRGLTVAVSNLGRVSLPEPAGAHVGRMLFHVSAVRPQVGIMSHAGLLTVSFTSPFVETGHVREFARRLAADGVEVTVAAARVTEAELAEVER
ncbi:alcohol acetyltransferase [Microlunatus sp. GCM10028923]|uniref:alcohol acetyltransferase n=1 Tax=Microlunatus sp. GCM10028923 TaxID=3273400 RepID=UPI003620DA3A